jgi:hypothetical protein
MDHVSSRVTLRTLALMIGCAEDCEYRCYSEAIDCIRAAQTTDEREICKHAYRDCYWSCPKTMPPQQYGDQPDE